MNISIGNIRINSISTIGSLNIGKTILCHNRAASVQFPKDMSESDQDNLLPNGVTEEDEQLLSASAP